MMHLCGTNVSPLSRTDTSASVSARPLLLTTYALFRFQVAHLLLAVCGVFFDEMRSMARMYLVDTYVSIFVIRYVLDTL